MYKLGQSRLEPEQPLITPAAKVIERGNTPPADELAPDQAQEKTLEYWPELDGLRSIAVLSVLLFHFQRNLLPGGFAGVDVFFVISGFLITRLLLDDIRHQRFSITRFYQRRVARIAPAFFLVLWATLVGSWLVYSNLDFASTGTSTALSSLSVVNMLYMIKEGYFQASPDARPNLHYWSLSVEEQFYIFFPMLLFAVVAWRTRAISILVALAGVSFVLCIVITWLNPVYAFFLLPTRVWELLAGAIVALLIWQGMPRPSTPWIPTVGLLMVAGSMFVLHDGDQFPGAIAALPVFGTALLLATAGERNLFSNRALSHPIPVFVGKRSYSLYLWHWPIFSLIDYQLFAASSGTRGIAKIALTSLLTLLTYQFLERPARTYLNDPRRKRLAIWGFLAACIVTVALGVFIRTTYFVSAASENIADGGVTIDGGRRGDVVLMGDSQAVMSATELESIARELSFTLHILAVADGNQLPGEPHTLWPQVEKYISRHPPDVVIISQAWGWKLQKDARDLSAALSHLQSVGAHIILLTQPPTLPPEASREGIRNGAEAPFFETSAARATRLRGNALVQSFAGYDVTVIDLSAPFIDATGGIRVIGEDGQFLFQDPGHLSNFGLATIRPLLEAEIKAALQQSALHKGR